MGTPLRTASAIVADLLARTDNISILPKDVGASEDGTAVDCTGQTRVEAWLAVAAASADTDFTIKVEKSPDGSTGWVDVAAGEISPGQPATINDDAAGDHNKLVTASVTIDTTKPHLRWSAAGSGGTPALIASGGIRFGSSARDLKPYEMEQMIDQLQRLPWSQGRGASPPVQLSVREILANG